MASLLSGLGNGWSKHAGFQDKHFFLILQIETKKALKSQLALGHSGEAAAVFLQHV